MAYQAEQTKYLKAMFASVRNAFRRSLAVTSDGAISVDTNKTLKCEPILDKEFIVSGFSECIMLSLLILPAEALLCGESY